MSPKRTRAQALAALGIIREDFAEMLFPNLLMVGFEGLPRRAFFKGCDACCHIRAPFISLGTVRSWRFLAAVFP